jgi:hypothetical protein
MTFAVHPLPPRRGGSCPVCARLGIVRKPEPFEIPHCHTVQEIATALKLSEETVRRIFQDMPGVIKITKGKRLRGKREYVTLRIPSTVLQSWYASSGTGRV